MEPLGTMVIQAPPSQDFPRALGSKRLSAAVSGPLLYSSTVGTGLRFRL